MKRLLTIVIAIVLLAAAGAVAHFHVAAQSYYPVVRIAAPEGLSYLAVMEVQRERQGCGAANDRYLRPIKAMCDKCRIVYARCERELEDLEAKLRDGKPVGYPQVDSPGLRMAVIGDGRMAKKMCDFIAADMMKRGVSAATCVAANRTPPSP